MEDTKRIEQKVFRFIGKHRMLTPGEGVVAGVSGGADSVCLLFVLSKWAAENNASIHVVHVNHGIREDADKDAAYVRQLCGELGLPFTLVMRDVKREAGKYKCSEEEMGRILRYEAFEQAAVQVGAQKIAVAHNGNDQAETMLFHLFRGSGLSGLCGIRPVRGQIIRPLLCLERREIEQYLNEKGISFCQDSTNAGDDYARNRIRHHILSYAQEQIAEGCVLHMNQTAQELQELQEYLEGQTKLAYGQVVSREWEQGEGFRFVLDRAPFMKLSPVIGRRLIMDLLKQLSPQGKDISRIHIESVMDLFSGEGNRRVNLPYRILARRQYDTVILERAEGARDVTVEERPEEGSRGKPEEGAEEKPEEKTEEKRCEDRGEREDRLCIHVDPDALAGGETIIPLGEGQALGFSLFERKKNENIPKKKYTKWFDYDKINKILTVRMREEGDFLTLRNGEQNQIHQSLKRFMVNEKIPGEERNTIALLAEDRHILWVIGYRISEFYKVSGNTRLVLRVRLLRREGEDFIEMEERRCQSM